MIGRSNTILLTIVFVVLASGCTGASQGPSEQVTPDTTLVTAAVDTQTETAGDPLGLDERTPYQGDPDYERKTPNEKDNPWGKEPVVISIAEPPGENNTRTVKQAVEYWETDGSEYAKWEPNFSVSSNEANPDVRIRFVSAIKDCRNLDSGGEVIGCASTLDASDRPRDPETVRIVSGLTNESTYRTVRHELGHILGLDHGEGPGEVMDESDVVYNKVYSVHINHENTAAYNQRISRRETRRALEYYSNGADGFMQERVRFVITEERSDADIVVNFIEYDGRGGSTAYFDGRVYIIEVEGIDLRKRGWHVGAWLGYFFGADSIEDIPPPFDEPKSDTREEWWR